MRTRTACPRRMPDCTRAARRTVPALLAVPACVPGHAARGPSLRRLTTAPAHALAAASPLAPPPWAAQHHPVLAAAARVPSTVVASPPVPRSATLARCQNAINGARKARRPATPLPPPYRPPHRLAWPIRRPQHRSPTPQTTTATAHLLPSRSSTAASNRFARCRLLPWPARSATSLTKPRVEVGVRTFHLPFPLPTPASGHLYRTAHGRRQPATAMAAVLLPAGPVL